MELGGGHGGGRRKEGVRELGIGGNGKRGIYLACTLSATNEFLLKRGFAI